LTELCDVLGLPHPDPAGATTENNAYVFERSVKETQPDGTSSLGRIDLYKRGCFVLEAKQSRQKGGNRKFEIGSLGSGWILAPKGVDVRTGYAPAKHAFA
jgi:hypothetical protein